MDFFLQNHVFESEFLEQNCPHCNPSILHQILAVRKNCRQQRTRRFYSLSGKYFSSKVEAWFRFRLNYVFETVFREYYCYNCNLLFQNNLSPFRNSTWNHGSATSRVIVKSLKFYHIRNSDNFL